MPHSFGGFSPYSVAPSQQNNAEGNGEEKLLTSWHLIRKLGKEHQPVKGKLPTQALSDTPATGTHFLSSSRTILETLEGG